MRLKSESSQLCKSSCSSPVTEDFRRQWAENLRELSTAGNGVIETYILSPPQILALIAENGGDGDRPCGR
jgi:hypothetical protein